jgi:acyl-coenzyme A synthetase/AMP-(fatty) acid ligase
MLGHLASGVTSVASAGPGQWDAAADAVALAADIATQKPQEIVVPPHLIGMLLELDLVDRERFKTVKRVKVGGSVLPTRIGKAMQSRLPDAKIYTLYGTTETAKALLVNPWDAARPDVLGSAESLQAAVKIVSPDGVEVPAGQPGEIALRLRGGSDQIEYFGHDLRTRLDPHGRPRLRR